jgi:hypothetical protein
MRAFASHAVFASLVCLAGSLSAQTTASSSGLPTSSTSSATTAAAARRNIDVTDPTGIAVASFDGDQDKLGFVASTTSNGPDVIAKALRQRSLYQLDASSKTVADCGAESKIGNSSANMQCAFTLAGNRLLINDIAGWAKIMQAIKTIAYPKILQQLSTLLHQDPATLMVSEFEVVPDYTTFLGLPAVSVARKGDAFDLPLQQQSVSDNGHAMVYAATVSVNGHPIKMVFDTGAPMLLLSADDAKTLQIDPVYPNWRPLPGGEYSSLGVIKHFEMGGVEISNLPVAISDKPLKFPLLGLNAIQYLAAFRIHGDTLHSVASGFSDCTTPMDMASRVNGTDQTFLVHGIVDGKPFPFSVSTGTPGAISRSHYGSPGSAESAKPYTVLSPFGAEYAWYSTSHATMQIGDGPSGEAEYQVIYHANHTRFRYYIGADYIRRHDLVMDFTHGTMCLK